MIRRSFSPFVPCLATLLLGGGVLSAQTTTTISTATTAAVNVASTNTLQLTSTGSITLPASSSTNAVTLNTGTSANPTTLLNSGKITQNGTGRGVGTAGTNQYISIQNMSPGIIAAVGNDALSVGTGSGTVVSAVLNNVGTIQTTTTGTAGNQAVNFGKILAGTNTITNSGTITAQFADAVRPGVNGTVNNSGTIRSTQFNGSGSDGIDAQTNSGAQIMNSGLVEGGRHGITGGAAATNITMSITNQTGGTIQGDNGSGINIDGNGAAEQVTITNGGTITGNGTTLASGTSSQDGDGVDVDGVVNLTNTGTIRSLNAIADTSEGVTVGGGTINNSGTIQGSVASNNTSGAVGRGITIAGVDKNASGTAIPVQAPYAATTIINGGLIKGDTDSAIAFTSALAGGFNNTITNQAGGVIEGGGTTAAAIQGGADNDTVNNAGTIQADRSGVAVDLGGGTNTLNVTGGSAQILGNVSGGANSTGSAFNVNPGSGNRFAYAGSISNFATVAVQSGTVTFSGASTYAGTTTVQSGGTLVVANSTGSATGTGAVNVQNGATLAGNGTVGGNLTLATGATLSPGVGNSAGTLTVGGNVSLSNGAVLVFLLGPGAAGSDLLNVAGTLSLASGQVRVDITDNGVTAGNRYTLVNFGADGGVTAASFTLDNAPAGFQGTFDVTGNSVGLTFNAVPEPSTWAALLVALAVVAWIVRTRAARV